MAKPLRSQLNQIRAWVRQGRTDAWIAHQLEVSTNELREFRRRHELSADGEESVEDDDLRDEIEAEIEAATREDELAAEAEAERAEAERAEAERREAERREAEGSEDEATERVGAGAEAEEGASEAEEGATDEDAGAEGDGDGERPRRRRRRRRGGRGRRAGAGMQASFDHGEDDGYGLWLDPSVKDDPVYSEHWAGQRRVEVTIEPDRIVIRRADSERRPDPPGD